MGPQIEKSLQRLADLSQNTVSRALDKLALYELAQHNGRQGWVIASGVRQLPLLGLMLGDGENKSQKLTLTDLTTTTYLTSREKAVEAASLSKEGELESKIDSNSLSKKQKKVHAALVAAGIFDPKAAQLAALEHVTVEYVQAMASKTACENKGTGLLIYRIEQGDPMPETRSNGHYVRCECESCQRLKYSSTW